MPAPKKNCPWCGIANPSDGQQCVGCGSDLGGASVRDPEAPKASRTASVTPKAQSATAHGTDPKAKAKTKAQPITIQIQPGFVYAGIAAVVILGYLYLKNDDAAPVVPQNTALTQSDTSGQRIASMERFLAANPADKEAQLAYANMLHDAKMYPKAIAAYAKYLAVVPKDPDARVDMAICLFESGDGAEAIAELKKALAYAPRHQPAMFNLGIVYLNQEKVQESNDWFSRCAAVDPTTTVGARAKQLLSQHSLTNKNPQ